jgi:PucR family transcriptional regulator, purine catabolism regulatory protein
LDAAANLLDRTSTFRHYAHAPGCEYPDCELILCKVTSAGEGGGVSEVVVGDLLIWEPELAWDGQPPELHRSLNWAVTIHASVPALPPLRGGELIVVPQRAIDELQRVEMIRWPDIARSLAGQSIAGLLVESGFEGDVPAGVAVLRAPESFMVDVEARLNRTITEHRGELYRLGSDLSRALSAASIGGADLDALLTVAAHIVSRDLVLSGPTGKVIGRSRDAPRRVAFTPVRRSDPEWSYGSAQPGWTYLEALDADGQPVYLLAGQGAGATPESIRLVLAQTYAAIETFLRRDGKQRSQDVQTDREALLADLLLGRVPAAQIDSRSRALAVDPAEPLRVALFVGNQPGFDGRVRTGLRRDIREHVCMLSAQELAVLIPEAGWLDWWDELEQLAREIPGVVLVRSEQQPGMLRAGHATRQARVTGRLRLAGIDPANTIFDLLLPLWDPVAYEPDPDRLRIFADRLLQPLELHDRERHGDVIRTLEGYLAAGGSATGAAGLLNVHRNTLGYRLRRISELTGADLDDEDTRLAFGIALRIRRLQKLMDG